MSRAKLAERCDAFARGEWMLLVKASRADAQKNNTATFRRRRCEESGDELGRRAKRAPQLTQWGELSSARLALEGALVAPGNEETRAQLIDPSCRPPVPRTPVAREFVEHNPEDQVVLDGEGFLKSPQFPPRRRSRTVWFDWRSPPGHFGFGERLRGFVRVRPCSCCW